MNSTKRAAATLALVGAAAQAGAQASAQVVASAQTTLRHIVAPPVSESALAPRTIGLDPMPVVPSRDLAAALGRTSAPLGRMSFAPQSAPRVAPPAYNWDLHDMSRYAGWGGAIGAAAGFVWGEATVSRHRAGPIKTRPLDIVGDAVIGFCAGMVGGGVVYVIHLARQP